MPLSPDERRRLDELRRILDRARRPARLSADELERLPRLYRHASSLYARLETAGDDAPGQEDLRRALERAHAVLYRPVERARGGRLGRAVRYLMVRSPRALRREWRMLVFSFALFYGFVLLAAALVADDLGMAFGLLDPGMVARELEQLEALGQGQPFRGNFTFGLGESPGAAGMVMANNMGVSILFFAAGLVPPLFLLLLATNGLMVGTYTAVAGHYGQAGTISSILWCHGALELQAIIVAGCAGMILVRGWLAPGPWSRRHAIRLESRRALEVLAPVFPMLFVAGLIEGFVSPHAPTPVRVVTAVVTGGAWLAWLLLAGRREDPEAESAAA